MSTSKKAVTTFDRRCFLQHLAGGALCLTVSGLGTLRADQPKRKPNVIMIFTDDQGSIDVNSFGATDRATPNLDRLGKRGVSFRQCYAAAPVCSPSRAALMTGRYPQRAGLPDNTSSEQGHAGMPTEQITIAEMLKAAGYATGHVGKWHLGYTPETMPNQQGFDESFGHMGGCIDNYSHFFYWKGPNRHDLWENGTEVWRDGEYFGDLMVDRCRQFITKNQQQPFFLYWAINFPHYPLQGKEKWRRYYQDMPFPRREYAAFVSTMDEMVGNILDHLDSLELTNDTIIIFQPDHGHSTEDRTGGGGGNAGPYRGAKFSLFEGGIRVPAIISWPEHLPQNQWRDQMVTACDWMPTIAELCRVSPPTCVIDGKSITGVIESADAPTPHELFHWQSGYDKKQGHRWAVRQGDWKLLGNPRDTSNKGVLTDEDRLFLVNLGEDVTEMKNLAKDYPDRVQQLLTLHEQWTKEMP